MKTSGQVQLVITVGFIENNSPLAERRIELRKLISESGWMKSRERFITCKDNLGSEEESLRAVEGCIERTNLEQEWGQYRRHVAKDADFAAAWQEVDGVD